MDNRQTIITYERVRDDANNIKDYANTMKGIFSDFTATMNMIGTPDVFAGTASASLSSSFTSLKSRFDSYTATVERFANLILNAAASAEATEQSIARDADNLAH